MSQSESDVKPDSSASPAGTPPNPPLARTLASAAAAILAAMLLIPVQVLWRPMEIVTNAPLHVLVAVHAFPEGSPRGTATYGWGTVPSPPMWFNLWIQRWQWAAWELVVGGTSIAVYHRLLGRHTRHRLLDGLTRCGRCGYPLRGVQEPRCPECGARIGVDDSSSHWFGPERRRSLAAVVVCLTAFLGLEYGALRLDEHLYPPDSWRFLTASWYPQDWSTVRTLSPTSLVTLVASLLVLLLVYQTLALRPRWRRGPTYCGRCGSVVGRVAEPRCPACSQVF